MAAEPSHGGDRSAHDEMDSELSAWRSGVVGGVSVPVGVPERLPSGALVSLCQLEMGSTALERSELEGELAPLAAQGWAALVLTPWVEASSLGLAPRADHDCS